ncbi:hypothetical protein [Paenibacillus tengchongensis]|uniref:hypothetical protein n=1 Tax=Paenibacillus tengchongensis TaxID=2608684 RepID=UPI00124BD0AC|nr:hypothetical protein [Paenibacillus tengchongensis]
MNRPLWVERGLLILGVLLAAAGLLAAWNGAEVWAGLGLGIGAGLIGSNTAMLLTRRYYRKRPEQERQKRIDSGDERSMAIRYQAKAKAFDRMIIVMIVVPFLLIAAQSPLWLVLAAVGLYLLAYLLQIVYTMKLGKQM